MPNSEGDASLLFNQNFPKTAWKWRNLVPTDASLDPPLGVLLKKMIFAETAGGRPTREGGGGAGRPAVLCEVFFSSSKNPMTMRNACLGNLVVQESLKVTKFAGLQNKTWIIDGVDLPLFNRVHFWRRWLRRARSYIRLRRHARLQPPTTCGSDISCSRPWRSSGSDG